MDTNGIDIACLDFFDRNGVLAGLTLTGCMQSHLETGTLCVVHATLQTRSLDIGIGGDATCHADEVAETLVLLLQGEMTGKVDLAINRHLTGLTIAGTTEHLDDVVGLKGETGGAINHKAFL